jgi:hypothetical protein
MYISDFKLVDILRDKMGEQEARTLVEYIEERIEDKYLEARAVFATKEDLLKLEMKILDNIHKANFETQKLITDSQAQIQKQLTDSKADTQKQFGEMQKQLTEVHRQIAESKSDMLKWMFGMILMATIGIIGTIITIMKMGGWGN